MPWFGRPVSAANKSTNDTSATRQAPAYPRLLMGEGMVRPVLPAYRQVAEQLRTLTTGSTLEQPEAD